MAICLLTVLGMGRGIAPARATGQNSQDMLDIRGSWVRTDASYVIELRHDQGGSLQATYFNRRPIHVEKTEVMEKGGLLYVMIVLRDVNYPGSIYLLAYDGTKDVLQGTYFHAPSRQSYDVGFVRKAAQ